MNRHAGWRVAARGKTNRPWKVARPPKATAGHKTANSSKCMSDRDARRHDVCDLPQWIFVLPTIQNRSQRSADQSAIKHQPVPSNRDDAMQRFACEFLIPIIDYEEQPRPDDRAK